MIVLTSKPTYNIGDSVDFSLVATYRDSNGMINKYKEGNKCDLSAKITAK